LARLVEVRRRLNEYADALHMEILPLRRTPFQAYGELAGLATAADLNFTLDGIAEMDAAHFRKIVDALDRFVAVPAVWENFEYHPWQDTLIRRFSFKTKTEIEYRFGELIDCLTKLELV